MKAIRYYGNKDLRFDEVPEPVPASGEMKLRVDFCGICATDVEEYLFGPKFISVEPNPVSGQGLPVITGHEVTGTVVEVAPGITHVSTGDRVVIDGFLACNACWSCSHGEDNLCPNAATIGFGRNGGLAEYLTWPAANAVKLPDGVSSEHAGLVEPSSVAHHAVVRGNVGDGMRVVVLGAGVVGLLAMQAARAAGAEVYAADQRRMSLDMATELGADGVLNTAEGDPAAALLDWTDGAGPDVVIDAAGAAGTPGLAVDWVRRGGRAVLVAIYTSEPTFDFNSLVSAEKEVVGSLGYRRSDIEAAVGLIARGKIRTGPLVSGVIGLDEVIDVGFERMLAPSKDVFRLLVSPAGG